MDEDEPEPNTPALLNTGYIKNGAGITGLRTRGVRDMTDEYIFISL